MVLEKTLESPLDCKEIQPVHPRGNQSEHSLQQLMVKLKLQYFGHLMRRADSFGKTLMWGKIEGKIVQLDGHGWTPRVGDGMLQFMGSQRVGHD